jgi:4-hydroxy-tetrahydrodipicolinate reductase
LNSELARLLNRHHGYKPFIEEIHHTKKLDAPSGTAVSVVKGITEANNNYSAWAFEGKNGANEIPVRSVREGDVPGTHVVEWTSEIDRITLKHEAFGRKGFAAGAVMAAEFIATRRGVFTMADVLGF